MTGRPLTFPPATGSDEVDVAIHVWRAVSPATVASDGYDAPTKASTYFETRFHSVSSRWTTGYLSQAVFTVKSFWRRPR